MEFQKLKSQAVEKLKVAEHLADTTYSIVKEPKLLVSVIENISQAMELSVTALLEYERSLKNIPSYEGTYIGKMEMFRRKIMTKHNISADVLDFMLDLRKTLDHHKKSSVAFTKKDKFVISDNDYNLKTLEIEDVKKTLYKAKRHVEMLFRIIKH